VTFENLLLAWEDFVQGKRSREDVNDFALHISDNLFDILFELQNERYVHGGYQEYIVCDPKKRTIHKASVKDRVIHRLLYNALYDYFDRRYIDDSYSCRVGKGTHKAQARFRNFVNVVSKNYTKSCYVLKFDIKKCFQSIDTKILKCILVQHIEDIKIRNLAFFVIDSFSDGLPLGNLTSQLFINVYLHELDIYVKQDLKVRYYLRYADDMVLVSADRKSLEETYACVQLFLKQNLLLISHKKMITSVYAGVDILGSVFFPQYERLRRSTERRKKRRETKEIL